MNSLSCHFATGLCDSSATSSGSSVRIRLVHFSSISFSFCSVVIRIHVGILWQMCVFHFREPSVSWYSQTASDWLAAVGAWWDQGTISVLIMCMCKACTIHMHTYCMHTHKWMHVYMCSACATIFLRDCETGFCVMASWMCACIYCLLWASRLLALSL